MNQGATRLLLIRHAHVDSGENGAVMCGWLDLPLSRKGQLQLQSFSEHLSAFSEELSAFKPEAVYASSSTRARVTAETLASNWRLPVSILPQLREISCGALEGMPVKEVKEHYPQLWTENALQHNSDFAWPNGESYRNFRQRVFEALNQIARRHVNARIPVVTHAGVISQVVGAMNNLSPAVWEKYRPGPFTATEVIWNGAPLDLISFNVAGWWRESRPHAG